MLQDHAHAQVDGWDHNRPVTEVGALGIVSRMERISKQMLRELHYSLKPLGLDPSSFEALAALRSQGPPFAMSPTALRRATIVTSGAMTSKIDRLESMGLVNRTPDPDDRRGVRVVLTQAGIDLADQAMESRLDMACQLVNPLSGQEQVTFASLLDKLMGAAPESAEPPLHRLSRRPDRGQQRQSRPARPRDEA